MERSRINTINTLLQWGLFLCINILFICKYVPRAGLNPVVCSVLYGVAVTGMGVLYGRVIAPRLNERIARNLSVVLLAGVVAVIALAIFFIEPLSINVDRWSATSYFLDALFRGDYPYGVHTHVSETNYPSPFPLWHYLNIPFWLVGDVGWIQACSLLFFVAAVWYYFRSWQALFAALLILVVSPAYWWEIATRSDGLSNMLLVCSTVLFIQRYPVGMQDKWWLLALAAGCVASTRMSAVIPFALYLFRPWLDTDWKRKAGFVLIALGVVLFFFAPYVLWDTDTWVFFHRNPFMSQSSPGNTWILLVMVGVALWIAYKKETFYYYVSTTSAFLFAFMLVSQLGVIWRAPEPVTLFDICCDISYFTLSLPFVIVALLLPDEKA